MILQNVAVGLKRLMNARDKRRTIATRRARLSVLLQAMTMGVFQNLQKTANEKIAAMMPPAPNTRIVIPPALE